MHSTTQEGYVDAVRIGLANHFADVIHAMDLVARYESGILQDFRDRTPECVVVRQIISIERERHTLGLIDDRDQT